MVSYTQKDSEQRTGWRPWGEGAEPAPSPAMRVTPSTCAGWRGPRGWLMMLMASFPIVRFDIDSSLSKFV